jgi:hypothetical protein
MGPSVTCGSYRIEPPTCRLTTLAGDGVRMRNSQSQPEDSNAVTDLVISPVVRLAGTYPSSSEATSFTILLLSANEL